MPAIHFDKFDLGIDLRKGSSVSDANRLLEMRNAGAPTIAQDERTSVVWGMPGEAVKCGGAELVLALDDIADRLMRMVSARVRDVAQAL